MLGKKIEKVIYIEGMMCNGCANRVNNALKELKEVKDVAVILDEKKALVLLKKNVEDKVLVDAIEALNFKVTSIE